jgi:hypothetical protein
MTTFARIAVMAAISLAHSASASRANELSGTCAMEEHRMRTLLAVDMREPIPPLRFHVSNRGIVEPAEEAIAIKRRILKGELPIDLHVLEVGRTTWQRASDITWFQATPNLSVEVPPPTAGRITPFLIGCWVSEDLFSSSGTRRRLQLWLWRGGGFSVYESQLDLTGREIIDVRTKFERNWSISVEGKSLSIELPDTPFLGTDNAIPFRIISGNEIRLDLPDAPDLPFRRM